MKTLKDLVAISSQIEQMLVSEDGEITPEIEALLAMKDAQLPDKIESYAHVVERLYHQTAFYSKKADMLYKISKACNNLADKVIGRVDQAMTDMEVDSISGHDHMFKRVGCAKRLVIDTDAILPDKYTTIKTEKLANKEEIKKALVSGEDIEGCRLAGGSYIKIQVNKG